VTRTKIILLLAFGVLVVGLLVYRAIRPTPLGEIEVWENDGKSIRYLFITGPTSTSPGYMQLRITDIEGNLLSEALRPIAVEEVRALTKMALRELKRVRTGLDSPFAPGTFWIDIVVSELVCRADFIGAISSLPPPMRRLRKRVWDTWEGAGPGSRVSPSSDSGRLGQAVCVRNLWMLVRHLLMYVADNDNAFPSPDTWCDAVELRLEETPYFPRQFSVCPQAPQLPCSYAYNSALAGLSPEALADPEHTVVLFESDAGWNAHGGRELLPEQPRHGEHDNYAFADGSARSYPRTQALDLHWRPRLRETGGAE